MAKLVGIPCAVGKSIRVLKLFRCYGTSTLYRRECVITVKVQLRHFQILNYFSHLCLLISEKDFTNILGQTAVKQVLDGTISEKGILAPMYSKINDPLMKELKDTYG